MSAAETELNPLFVYLSVTGKDVFTQASAWGEIAVPVIYDETESRHGRVSPGSPHKVIYIEPNIVRDLNPHMGIWRLEDTTMHISVYQNRDFVAPRESIDGLKHTTQLHLTFIAQARGHRYLVRLFLSDEHLMVGLTCKPLTGGETNQDLKEQILKSIGLDHFEILFNGISNLLHVAKDFLEHQQQGLDSPPREKDTEPKDSLEQTLAKAEARFEKLLATGDELALQDLKYDIMHLYRKLLETKSTGSQENRNLIETNCNQKDSLLGFKILRAMQTHAHSSTRKPGR